MPTNEIAYSEALDARRREALCPPRNEAGYNAGVRLLHWASAAVIIAAWSLGVGLELFPRGAPRAAAMDVHSTLGIVVFSLAVLRVLWRSVTTAPPVEGPEWMAKLAHLGHTMLYGFVLAVPLSGMMARWAYSGVNVFVGGLVVPAPFPLPLAWLWADAHSALAYAFSMLVGVHIAAALYHHVILRDSTLRRMLPAR